MAISTGGGGETPMSDINTTPLVDVMLVMLIIFIIAVPVAMQTVEELQIPIFESTESEDKVENLLLNVTTTDEAGLTPSVVDTAYSGASRNGECRVFFNNVTPVSSQELYDQAFERLARSGRGGLSCHHPPCALQPRHRWQWGSGSRYLQQFRPLADSALIAIV